MQSSQTNFKTQVYFINHFQVQLGLDIAKYPEKAFFFERFFLLLTQAEKKGFRPV